MLTDATLSVAPTRVHPPQVLPQSLWDSDHLGVNLLQMQIDPALSTAHSDAGRNSAAIPTLPAECPTITAWYSSNIPRLHLDRS